MSGHPTQRWRDIHGVEYTVKPHVLAQQLVTYAKLRGGGFGVRGWSLSEGQQVIAIAQSGKERTVHVRKVLWSDPDGRCLATVKELPTGRYYGSAERIPYRATAAPTDGRRCGACHHLDPAQDREGALGVCSMECACASCGALFWGLGEED